MDGALYDYEIQYNASQVLYERLVKTNKSLKEELFVRQWDGTEYSYETFQTASQELTKYTRNNTAFLSVLHVFNDPDALKIFDWFYIKFFS